MTCAQRLHPSALAARSVACAVLVAVHRLAAAQAWVPPAGVGTVSVVYQRIDNTGHRDTDGVLHDQSKGKSLDLGVYVEAEYAVTDRFSVSAGVPYVFAKYVDPAPPPPFIPFLPVDQCRCWHSGWQDLGFTARYNVINVNRTFVVTPSASLGEPSHDYAYQGEAVVGRRLKELRLAVDAGYRVDSISPRLSVTGRYSYAIVEQVLDVPNNRSNVSLEGAFAFSRKFSARALTAWQHTHGGLRSGPLGDGPPPFGFGDFTTPELVDQHDRLVRDNNFRAGGGAAYQFPRLDVFATYLAYASGTDTHAGHVFTAGVSVPFELTHRK